MSFTSYEGPGSFGTTLLHMCQEKGIETVSMTVRTPYYPEFDVVISHDPKAIRAVVRRLNHLLRLGLDFSDLDKAVREFEGKLDFMIGQKPEFRAYIEQLEKSFVEVKYEEPLEISADEAVKMAEEFLKHDKDD